MIKKLCERLKELRGNTSQASVAHEIGVSSQQVYQRYETGERTPDAEMLLRIATFYGVSCDYLIGATNVSSIPTDGKLQAAADITGLSEKALSKLTEFKAMNHETKYTDTLSLLIESVNMEYLLSLMAALISQNVKSNNAHNGNDTEIVRYLIDSTMPLNIDGTKVNIYKSTLLSSALQNAIVDTIDTISEKISDNGGTDHGKH